MVEAASLSPALAHSDITGGLVPLRVWPRCARTLPNRPLFPLCRVHHPSPICLRYPPLGPKMLTPCPLSAVDITLAALDQEPTARAHQTLCRAKSHGTWKPRLIPPTVKTPRGVSARRRVRHHSSVRPRPTGLWPWGRHSHQREALSGSSARTGTSGATWHRITERTSMVRKLLYSDSGHLASLFCTNGLYNLYSVSHHIYTSETVDMCGWVMEQWDLYRSILYKVCLVEAFCLYAYTEEAIHYS